MEQPFHLFVGDRAPQADVIHVGDRYEHRCLVGNDAKMEKAAGRAEDRFLLDLFDDTETMVWVNDLVANLKGIVCLASGSESEGLDVLPRREVYRRRPPEINGKGRKSLIFCVHRSVEAPVWRPRRGPNP